MKTTHAETHCPECGRRNELHDNRDGASPSEGDCAICFGCLYVGIFTFDGGALSVRHSTPEEKQQIANNPRVASALASLALAKARHQFKGK